MIIKLKISHHKHNAYKINLKSPMRYLKCCVGGMETQTELGRDRTAELMILTLTELVTDGRQTSASSAWVARARSLAETTVAAMDSTMRMKTKGTKALL